MPLEVHQFPVLKDNYAFLVRDMASGSVLCVDTPDAEAIVSELDRLGWSLSLIVNTHWHSDHIGGNAALQAATGCKSFGPAEVAKHVPLDGVVKPGDRVAIGETYFEVLDVGGHTLQHVAYYNSASAMVFVGDALFPLGCGRLFEGTPMQNWASLQRLASLPQHTKVYAAHEYAEGNARFALTVDHSEDLKSRVDDIFATRARGDATVPTTVALEIATNPFLRAPTLIGTSNATEADYDAFARMRAAKDNFRG